MENKFGSSNNFWKHEQFLNVENKILKWRTNLEARTIFLNHEQFLNVENKFGSANLKWRTILKWEDFLKLPSIIWNVNKKKIKREEKGIERWNKETEKRRKKKKKQEKQQRKSKQKKPVKTRFKNLLEGSQNRSGTLQKVPKTGSCSAALSPNWAGPSWSLSLTCLCEASTSRRSERPIGFSRQYLLI